VRLGDSDWIWEQFSRLFGWIGVTFTLNFILDNKQYDQCGSCRFSIKVKLANLALVALKLLQVVSGNVAAITTYTNALLYGFVVQIKTILMVAADDDYVG